MPLADVLQWVDAHRSEALVVVDRGEGLTSWLATKDRMLIATGAPVARGMLATDGTPSAPGPGLKALAHEMLLDLFLVGEGKFELRERAPLPSPHVEVDLHLPFFVMEGMRLVDEWPRLVAAYPDPDARLRAVGEAPAEASEVVKSIIRIAKETPSLARAWMTLGLSKQSLLRHVDELRLRGLIEVDGSAQAQAPAAGLVEQATLLLREGQFDEAAHVFRSLLASDPTDARVRHLLAECEQQHVAALYEQLLPTDVARIARAPGGAKLSAAEQAVCDCLEGRERAVAVVVLVSPLRELETLKALRRLVDRDVVSLEPAD
ncbi:MAG: DUF4388 domain-containing protein [Sandaracinaceae bacterium]|nr:DUF4388 domain-containing protein [Sandaracinaceae bacterium]